MANTNITPVAGSLSLSGNSAGPLVLGIKLSPAAGSLVTAGHTSVVSPGVFHLVDYQPLANGPGANVETQSQYIADLAGPLANGLVTGILYPSLLNKILRQCTMVISAVTNFIANTNNTSVLDDGNLPSLISQFTAAISSAASTPTPPVPATPTGLAVAESFSYSVARIKWDQMPYATGYTVVVKHTTGGATLRTIPTTDLLCEYSYEDCVADGGPFPDLTFTVSANNSSGTSAAATLIVTPKPVPSAPSITQTAVNTGVVVSATPPTDTTIVGLKIWASTTNGFTPSGGNLVYQGKDTAWVVSGLTGGTPYYFQAAFYDLWGQEGTHTSQFTATPSSASGTGGISVVGSLGAVPAEGTVVYLTTDDKLYRSNGTSWLKSVDGADLVAASVAAAAISVSNLSTINQALGSITSGQWVMNGGTDFIRGGMTAYATGKGLWLGFASGNWEFALGNSAAASPLMTWDGTTMNIVGADVNVDTVGSVFGGQSAYNTGTGFWMGFSGAAFVFSLGNSAGAGMTWNGTALQLNSPLLNAAQGTFQGALSNTTGTHAGTLTGNGVVTTANLAGNAATAFQANENTAAVNLTGAFQDVTSTPGLTPATTIGLIIIASVDLQNPGGGGGNHQVQLQRSIGGGPRTTIWTGYAYQLATGQSAAFSKTWYDAPGGSSPVAYFLQVKATNASDQCKNASIVVMELRR